MMADRLLTAQYNYQQARLTYGTVTSNHQIQHLFATPIFVKLK